MPKVFKMNEIQFQQKQSPVPEFSWHTTPDLSRIVGSRDLSFYVRSLDPGKYSYPYHSHRNSEELFVIMSGKAMLRTPAGISELEAGNIAFFEMGPEGSHQLYNHTDQPCLYLDLGTENGFDVCDYPDSGKTNILPDGEIYKKDDRTDYFEGENNVSEKWPAEVVGSNQEA